MNPYYPTAGDYAYSVAQGAQTQIEFLSNRVTLLEHTVTDLLTRLEEAGIVEVVNPDYKE